MRKEQTMAKAIKLLIHTAQAMAIIALVYALIIIGWAVTLPEVAP